MRRRKRIALIAHDNCKLDLLDWARCNVGTLRRHELFATGTTGTLLTGELGLQVTRFLEPPARRRPAGRAGVAEGRIDFVLFFWDPLEPQPHDVDVKALLRIAVRLQRAGCLQPGDRRLRAVSPLMDVEYQRLVLDHSPPAIASAS